MDQVGTRKRWCRSASEWGSIMARHEASGLSGERFCGCGGHRQKRVLALAASAVGPVRAQRAT